MSENITIGIRLKADGSGLVGEVRLSRKELDKLGRAAKGAGSDAEKGAKGVKKFGGGCHRAAKEARELNEANKNLGISFSTLRNVIIGLGLAKLASDFVQTGIVFDRINVSLRAVIGSTAAGAREFAWLEQQSDRLGLRLRDVAGAYAQLIAAARGTNMEGEASRQIFLAISEASTVYQLSAERQKLALYAVQQMISKGVVTMEELRRQLGDSLPGAFEIAARAMNMTTRALSKMIGRGELMTKDFLPRFSAQMRKELAGNVADAAKSANSEVQRFYNSLDLLKRGFTDNGFMDGFVAGLKGISEILTDPAFRSAMKEMGKLTGEMIKMVTTNGDVILALIAAIKGAQGGAAFGGELFGKRGAIIGGMAGALAAGGGTYLALNRGGGENQPADAASPPDPFARPGSSGGTFKPANQKATDLIDSLKLEGQQIFRLADARMMSVDAYQAVTDRIKGENLARKAGLKDSDAEYGQVINMATANEELRRTLKLLNSTGKDQDKIMKDVQRRYEKLPKTYDQMIRAAGKWRDETMAGLDETKAGYSDFAAMVDDVYRDQLISAYDKSLDASKEWQDGITRGLRDVRDASWDMASQFETAVKRLDSAGEETFINLVRGTKTVGEAFQNMADVVINEMLRIIYRKKIAGPLAEMFGGAVNSLFGGSGGDAGLAPKYQSTQVAHAGGRIGGPNAFGSRRVPASVFADAPRFHGGGRIGADERPIIGKVGEVIGWPDQLARAFGGGSSTQVTIIDQRGADAPDIGVKSSRGSRGIDLVEIVVPAVERAADAGRFDGNFSANFGAQRQAVAGA